LGKEILFQPQPTLVKRKGEANPKTKKPKKGTGMVQPPDVGGGGQPGGGGKSVGLPKGGIASEVYLNQEKSFGDKAGGGDHVKRCWCPLKTP